MAWEKRSNLKYYYRAKREAGKIKKVYCGGGATGQAAAQADEARRVKQQADDLEWLREKTQMEAITAFARTIMETCELLADAALLGAGFHRAKRSPWRPWHAARDSHQCARRTGSPH